jgi:hypothetical protein
VVLAASSAAGSSFGSGWLRLLSADLVASLRIGSRTAKVVPVSGIDSASIVPS